MFERFTDAARGVVVAAQEVARELGHPAIGTEHLLLALLAPEAGLSARVLAGAGVRADAVRAALARAVPPPAPLISAEDAAALHTIGIDAEAVLGRLTESLGAPVVTRPGPRRRRGLRRRRGCEGGFGGAMPFSPRAKLVLAWGLREAVALRSDRIGPEHLLLGLIREGAGLGAQVLIGAGVSLPGLRSAVLAAIDDVA